MRSEYRNNVDANRRRDLPSVAEERNPSRREFQAELRRRREVVSPEPTRRSLGELSARFVQLERAFSHNIDEQRRQESKMRLLDLENQELRCFNERNTRIKMEMATNLSAAIEEKNYWREAFLKQKNFSERYEEDRKNAVVRAKDEYDEIFRRTKESTEEHFRELVGLYESSKEKVKQLEDQLRSLRGDQRTNECRAYELANLLETLQSFRVDVNAVCHLTATALKNLTARGNSFEVDLKALRRLSWSNDGKRDDQAKLQLPKTQNSVFREDIESLKRKFQAGEVPVKDDKPPTVEVGKIHDDANNNSGPTCNKFYANTGARDCQKENAVSKDLQEKHVLRKETRLNGILFEEYVIRFSKRHEMRLKHSPQTGDSLSHLKLKFVDNEDEYRQGSLDEVLIFLSNVYTVVKYQNSGINCGSQTMEAKFSTSCTQTSVTGIEKYSRLNIGRTMLNSEKRAIERCLRNLERTVASLKCNALGQARSMIGKDSKLLGNDEFFECIKALTR